jgi:acid phosphatase (class A)
MFTKTLLTAGLLMALSGAANATFTQVPGFLTDKQAPDSLMLLPPPPAMDSAAFARDKAAYEEGLKLRDTPRGKQATNDADLSDGNLGKPFSEAVGVDISQKHTPQTYILLKKLLTDSGDTATKSAKNYYKRTRPFALLNVHSCTPDDESFLRKNGSYPSGHTAFGWTTALILSEMIPERQNEILKRGYEFGQSRVICGAHWQSDVDAGRVMGAAAASRLQIDPAFKAQYRKAQKELRDLQAHKQS